MTEHPEVHWAVSPGLTPYPSAVEYMEERAAAIASGASPELIWLVEHPPLYTAGTSAKPTDLLDPERLPVYRTGRGGQYTYHGPGQRVVYTMIDLRRRGGDVRAFVCSLERSVIEALRAFDVEGETRADRVGVWVRRPELGEGKEDKIAAIGIRVRRWVTFHGLSFNVAPDLSNFSGIVACGVREHGVTSLADLGRKVMMETVDNALRSAFERWLGAICDCDPPALSKTEAAESVGDQ